MINPAKKTFTYGRLLDGSGQPSEETGLEVSFEMPPRAHSKAVERLINGGIPSAHRWRLVTFSFFKLHQVGDGRQKSKWHAARRLVTFRACRPDLRRPSQKKRSENHRVALNAIIFTSHSYATHIILRSGRKLVAAHVWLPAARPFAVFCRDKMTFISSGRLRLRGKSSD